MTNIEQAINTGFNKGARLYTEEELSTEREKAYKQGLEDAADYIYSRREYKGTVESLIEEAKNLSAKK